MQKGSIVCRTLVSSPTVGVPDEIPEGGSRPVRVSRRLVRVLVWAALVLCAAAPLPEAAAPADDDTAHSALTRILARLALPLASPPRPGRAWLCELRIEWNGQRGHLLLCWDDAHRHLVRVSLPEYGSFDAGITPAGSWLRVPRHKVRFSGTAADSPARPLLSRCRTWPRLKGWLGLGILSLTGDRLPGDCTVRRLDGDLIVHHPETDTRIRLQAEEEGGLTAEITGPVGGTIQFSRWDQVDVTVLNRLLEDRRAEFQSSEVSDRDLRWMIATAADLLSERALIALDPALLPDLFPDIPRVHGRPVLTVEGTPEQMGKTVGSRLREAVRDCCHRVVHGLGMVQTLDTGMWFPDRLARTWDRVKPHIPDRYVRELNAMADAADLPRRWIQAANVYPEHFHCSGFALRDRATAGGQLLHGRILDYVTEAGLQRNALLTVVRPEGRHAWINVGYAGFQGSVTAMNRAGLAIGEMGGGGEGHLDGVPMSFLVRDVVERFDEVDKALEWMESVPRTCEYFYVLSGGRGTDIAGVASLARSLARERGEADFQVVRPGEPHPLLPHTVPDAVVLSSGSRYVELVERIRAGHGDFTPRTAWGLMGAGVATESALHIVLFLPETLEFWVSDAALSGAPAYTRSPDRYNLADLLARP